MRMQWISTGADVARGDLGEERALLGGALHQMHAEISVIRLQDGNDEARKARA